MFDKQEIKQLKEVFATKDDIKNFEAGLKENFATKKEIEYLIDVVATKEELIGVEKRLNKRIDKIDVKLAGIATKEDVKSLNKKLDSFWTLALIT